MKNPRVCQCWSSLNLVEWRGFGTEEDEAFLANVDLFSPTGTFVFNQPSYLGEVDTTSMDYQMMYEDDHLLDSFSFDLSTILSKATSSTRNNTGKKTWSQVVGYDHVRPPLQYTTPKYDLAGGLESSSEANDELNSNPPRETCRYWLNGNCMYGEHCRYAHHTTKQDLSRKKEFFDEMSSKCCICNESIADSGKRFGLMQSRSFGGLLCCCEKCTWMLVHYGHC